MSVVEIKWVLLLASRVTSLCPLDPLAQRYPHRQAKLNSCSHCLDAAEKKVLAVLPEVNIQAIHGLFHAARLLLQADLGSRMHKWPLGALSPSPVLSLDISVVSNFPQEAHTSKWNVLWISRTDCPDNMEHTFG